MATIVLVTMTLQKYTTFKLDVFINKKITLFNINKKKLINTTVPWCKIQKDCIYAMKFERKAFVKGQRFNLTFDHVA